MSELFNTFIYQPIFAALLFIYQNISFGDLGVAIIFLTLGMRLVLLPIFYKSAKDQSLMQALQPHIKKIQLDHKNNKEEQAKALLNLYREHRLNPLSGFLLLLIQLPLFFALFRIFREAAVATAFDSHYFLGLINLAEKNIFIVAVAALFQYGQSRLMMSRQANQTTSAEPMAQAGRMMIYLGPVLTIVILVNLPSALALYWATSNLFSLIQQYFINKKINISKHE